MGSQENLNVISRVNFLLSKKGSSEWFSQSGFNPIDLDYPLELTTNLNEVSESPTLHNSNLSLPLETSQFKLGDDIPVEFRSTPEALNKILIIANEGLVYEYSGKGGDVEFNIVTDSTFKIGETKVIFISQLDNSIQYETRNINLYECNSNPINITGELNWGVFQTSEYIQLQNSNSAEGSNALFKAGKFILIQPNFTSNAESSLSFEIDQNCKE